MFDVIKLVHVRDDPAPTITALRAAVGGDPTVGVIAPTLPGTRNGGDVLVRLRFADESVWRSLEGRIDELLCSAEHIDSAEYVLGSGGSQSTHGGRTVYRALLLRVTPETPEATVAAFERDLLAMPHHITAIRAWRLSRVTRGPWTHVWEQEFTDLDGLTGPYLMHPIHWGWVDRWFDPECPDAIVLDRICHSFCHSPGGILSRYSVCSA